MFDGSHREYNQSYKDCFSYIFDRVVLWHIWKTINLSVTVTDYSDPLHAHYSMLMWISSGKWHSSRAPMSLKQSSEAEPIKYYVQKLNGKPYWIYYNGENNSQRIMLRLLCARKSIIIKCLQVKICVDGNKIWIKVPDTIEQLIANASTKLQCTLY